MASASFPCGRTFGVAAARRAGPRTLAVGFLLLAMGCGGGGGEDVPIGGAVTDYSRAGAIGVVPDVGSSQLEGDYSVEQGIPNPPACDVPYEVLVRAREPIGSCAGYDFRPLYDRATALANARVAEILCPVGCVSSRG
jgi:hypothetical protein